MNAQIAWLVVLFVVLAGIVGAWILSSRYAWQNGK